MDFRGNDILALKEMLGNNIHVEHNASSTKIVTPASMVNFTGGIDKDLQSKKIGPIQTEISKDIWKDSEIPNEDDVEDFDDKRARPNFEILYKQDVMTEDVFLGMGDKDPSSAHCDAMVVRIHFPGHTMKDLDLDVTKQRLVAESSQLKLSTYLPYPVRHNDGKAKWDPKKENLVVTLPIIRDEW